MRHFSTLLLTLLLTAGLASCKQEQQFDPAYPFNDPTLSKEERVNDLLSRLTTEEKVTMMMNSSAAIDRLGIPAYNWWNEALHGVARAGEATVFPQVIGIAATFDEDLNLETYTIASDEARGKYNDAIANGTYRQYYGLTFWTPNATRAGDAATRPTAKTRTSPQGWALRPSRASRAMTRTSSRPTPAPSTMLCTAVRSRSATHST